MDNKKYIPKYNRQSLKIGAGLSDVDGIKPSPNFYTIVENSSSYEELQKKLEEDYKATNPSEEAKQCDIIASRIAQVIESNAFSFRPTYLASIHNKLFNGVFTGEDGRYVGTFRDYDIQKKEPIINNHTVYYATYDEISEGLAYDFNEFHIDKLRKLDKEKLKTSTARFISRIWQIHPFTEGNTRATTVFLIQCLNSLGVKVDNSLFAKNAKYFRDSLVLSNFSYHDKDIHIPNNTMYLESFFDQLFNGSIKSLPKLKKPFEEIENQIPKITAIEARNYHTNKIDYLVFDERDPNTGFIMGKDSFNPKSVESILGISDNKNYIMTDNNGELSFTSNVKILDNSTNLPNELMYVKNDYEGYEGLLPNKAKLTLVGVSGTFSRNKNTKNITINGTGKNSELIRFNTNNPLSVEKEDLINSNPKQEIDNIIIRDANVVLDSVINQDKSFDIINIDLLDIHNSTVKFVANDNIYANQFIADNSTIQADKNTIIRADKFNANEIKALNVNNAVSESLMIVADIAKINNFMANNIDISIKTKEEGNRQSIINNITTNGKVVFLLKSDAEITNSKGHNGTEIEIIGFDNMVELNKVENITKLIPSPKDDISINMRNCQIESQEVIDEFKGKIHYDKNTEIGDTDKLTEKTTTQGNFKAHELGQG